MNTDSRSDDSELMNIVDKRVSTAVEDSCNCRERELHHIGNRHPRENLTALGPHYNTKSSHENDCLGLMEIVAQRAVDARLTIDSEEAQELGFPRPHNGVTHPLSSLNGAMVDQKQCNNPISSIAMTSLRRMPNVTEVFLQPGAYPVDGIIAPLQDEDGTSGLDNEGENWEEHDIQAVAYPINHQGSEELLPSGVPFITRNRAAWKRKLWCYVSLEMIIGMLGVTTFLVIFVVANQIIGSGASASQSVAENGLLYKTIDLPNTRLMNGCWRTNWVFKPIPIGG
ncbi:unknown protein [Seminavis robusta]|uniref:Uncharacterized protein n=1 Tax=Seminavis robusta TaxID=568900 RepID=A0A9N8HKT8_9STRA|nr:unknown protein [Seminavis robusta]|eukprot:Sro777_g201020.1 n/a (283) ;mRNA; r:20314-21265